MKNIAVLFVILGAFWGCKKPELEDVVPVDDDSIVVIDDGNYYMDLQEIAFPSSSPWSIKTLGTNEFLLALKKGKLGWYKDTVYQEINFPIEVASDFQGGLMGLALHPNFKFNNLIYFTYSKKANNGLYTVFLGRAKFSEGQVSNFEELLEANAYHHDLFHLGSRIVFDKNGHIYMSIGDRAMQNEAQNLSNHIGTILRLDEWGNPLPDNPFYNDENALPEIWSFGHRNPQGLAIHPVTQALWSHEHGPMGGDEINIIEKGGNYGWPLVTLGINYDGTIISPDSSLEGMIDPIHFWTPSIAPSDMLFYRGDEFPAWQNHLLIGALRGAHLNKTIFAGAELIEEKRLYPDSGRLRSLDIDENGVIYLAYEHPHRILRLRRI